MTNYFKRRLHKAISLQDALDNFFSRHQDRANLHVAHLWENWGMVMGEYLGKIALPLGTQNRTLLIGADDSMLMNDLSFYTPEILGRANAFMREAYFDKIRLSPLRGRTPLYPAPPKQSSMQEPDIRTKPENLGGLLGILDPDSPIGKAYASYVKSFD